jgi:hypothetical protein
MNSHKQTLVIMLLAASLLTGWISLNGIQFLSAQLSGLPGLEKIPGYRLFEEAINDNDESGLSLAVAPTPDYRIIDKALVSKDPNKIQAILKTHGHIPTDGTDGAFGYGMITAKGLNAVMVSTSHQGVLDSVKQTNKNDAVWHNHYVSLGSDPACSNNPAVKQITYQSPGGVIINDKTSVLSNLPATFTGTDALTKAKLTLSPGTDAKRVVSFALEPVFDISGTKLKAVCVIDIHDAVQKIINP